MKYVYVDHKGRISLDGLDSTPCLLYVDNHKVLHIFTGTQQDHYSNVHDIGFQFKSAAEKARERAVFSQAYLTKLNNGRLTLSKKIMAKAGISICSSLEIVPTPYLSLRAA